MDFELIRRVVVQAVENHDFPYEPGSQDAIDIANDVERILREKTIKPRVVPGVGICKVCDASSTRLGNYGREIPGEKCLGCGGPVYELIDTRTGGLK